MDLRIKLYHHLKEVMQKTNISSGVIVGVGCMRGKKGYVFEFFLGPPRYGTAHAIVR